MNIAPAKAARLATIALLTLPVAGTLSAQEIEPTQDGEVLTTVYGATPVEGPDIDGVITARRGDQIQVTSADGTNTVITVEPDTEIRGTGGFLGLGRTTLGMEDLLNGIPVEVETMQAGELLLASEIKLKKGDLETAQMIQAGTAQKFAEQRFDIDANTAAAEALRGRMGNIDNYNIKGTTNVYFDTGKWAVNAGDRAELCQAASQAETMDNALLLVVGYTDSVGDQDYNQTLSEKRAARVVNILQQECGWKPWRMLTPTGFAEADPAADNSTAEGRRQNRRVSVNILVSKAAEEG
ncbi:OmpA family protein [Qipengyuania sp. XHP0207]|uniref:OmpA family protein n=1 Tax=Qipengyuania sp. XHP0207 TaxID=3038078 RepID=UPI00241F7034|nr:OmpA family protein [Qipengyuania sp. XHP0207]MDG5748721.1 OmpA family protein [Qipengyuania sp. XHP0207]